MLSISQTTNGFYCIEWSPTENGPKIIKHKHISINKSIEEEGVLKKIISFFKPTLHTDSTSLSITLNIDKFLISQIKCGENINNKDYIRWYEKNILNDDFKKKYDMYYFPLAKGFSFLNLSINKDIKHKLFNLSSELGYNLMYLSVDIFSSATLLKQISNNNNFLIWKIGKNNYHYLLNIVNGKICSYAKYKKQGDNLTDRIKIGDNKTLDELSKFLYSILIKNKDSKIFNNVYTYQTNNNNTLIKKISSMKDSNIKLFDISKIFVKEINLSSIKCSKYVENGISFRGLDV